MSTSSAHPNSAWSMVRRPKQSQPLRNRNQRASLWLDCTVDWHSPTTLPGQPCLMSSVKRNAACSAFRAICPDISRTATVPSQQTIAAFRDSYVVWPYLHDAARSRRQRALPNISSENGQCLFRTCHQLVQLTLEVLQLFCRD
jgi:hypothetical protein